MPSCDMCGSQGKLFRTIVEGTEMMLCQECSKFGKVISAPKIIIKKESRIVSRKPEIIEVIVQGYGSIIKEKRERLGMKQEDLAKRINEKESLIQNIESGKFKPSISLAKKIESFLKISLVEVHEEEGSASISDEKGPVTIGDIIQIKRRSK